MRDSPDWWRLLLQAAAGDTDPDDWFARFRLAVGTVEGVRAVRSGLERLRATVDPCGVGLPREVFDRLEGLCRAAQAAHGPAPRDPVAALRAADPPSALVASFRDEVPVAHRVAVPVAVVDGTEGQIGELICERLDTPGAGLALHPADWPLAGIGPDFEEAITRAFHAATDGEPCVGRWRVRIGGRAPRGLGGPSAGAAARLAWQLTLDGCAADAGLLVMAAFEGDRLVAVDGIEAKLQAALVAGRFDTVVVSPGNEVEARDALARRARSRHPPLRLLVLDNLADLLNARSLLVEELLALFEGQETQAGGMPAWFPAHLQGPAAFGKVRQRVRVLEDRAWLEEIARERENAVLAGAPDPRWYQPRAAPDDDGKGPRRREDRPPPPPPVPWDEEAGARFGRAVVLGDPGTGKSWLLRFEAWHLARSARERLAARRAMPEDLVIPLRVDLPTLAERLADADEAHPDPAERFADALLELLVPDDFALLRPWLRARLFTGGCALLLDAWDEVATVADERGIVPRECLEEHLGTFVARIDGPAGPAGEAPGTGTRILLTSRVVGYAPRRGPGPPVPGAQELELLAFDWPEIETFARAMLDAPADGHRAEAFLAELRRQPALLGLARIPLMATFLCLLAAESGSRLPERRVEVYAVCLERLLHHWPVARSPTAGETELPEEVRALLPRLLGRAALALLQAGEIRFTRWRIVELFAKALPPGGPRPEWDPADLVEECAIRGILVGAELGPEPKYLFLHRSFMEYLAAHALAERADALGFDAIREVVDRRSWDPAWQEVVVLLAGVLDDPEPLLELLADEKRDDILRHRLVLAGRCLGEVAPALRPKLADIGGRIAEQVLAGWRAARDELGAHFAAALPGLAAFDAPVHGRPFQAWLGGELEGAEFEVRLQAFWIVRQAGAAAATSYVLAALTEALRDDAEDVRRAAAQVLGELGEKAATPEVLAALVAALRNGDAHVRSAAAEALGALGPAAATPEVLAALTDALRDEAEGVREAAASALGRLGEKAATPEVLVALVAALRDGDARVRSAAASALGRLGEKAATPEALRALVEVALRDEEWRVCGAAAEALGALGQPAAMPEELRALVEVALRDEEWWVRKAAASALGELGPKAAIPKVLAALVETALRDEDEDVREAAASAFGRLGPKEAIPEVLAALRDEDEDVREAAASAFGRLGPKEAIPEVLAALRDEDEDVREAAASALGRLGEKAATPEVLAALVATLRNGDARVRSAAAEALGALGQPAATPEALRALVAALRDGDARVRSAAAEALGALGQPAATPEALRALVAALRDGDARVRSAAAEALGALGQPAATPEALRALVEVALRDEERWVRGAAAQVLGELGEKAATPEVLAALVAALRDTDADLREAAEQTLMAWSRAGLRVFVRSTWFGWKKTYVVRRVYQLASIPSRV